MSPWNITQPKCIVTQRFSPCTASIDAALAAALACLSARFSLSDLPDFLVIDCRGDLSDMSGPSISEPCMVPVPQPYASVVRGEGVA